MTTMLKEVSRYYADSFKTAHWTVRLQHLYLLAVPIVLTAFVLYLSTKW